MKSCQTNRFYSRFSISCLLLWATMLCAAPWPVAEPESVGFQKDKLEKIAEYAKENTGTTGLVVVVNGKVIYTYGDIKQVSYTASCRKSVLSMLYGKYVANGTIKLDETIGQLGIDDVQGLLPQEKEATVYDLITARSGVYHPASNPGGIPEDKKYERGVTRHGTRFVYNNWDFNVAGTVFTLKTGLDIYDALEQDLAKPLGMEDFDRARHKLSGNAEMSKHLAYYMAFLHTGHGADWPADAPERTLERRAACSGGMGGAQHVGRYAVEQRIPLRLRHSVVAASRQAVS